MEEESEIIPPLDAVFIKSEPIDADFEEEKLITPADTDQIMSRKYKSTAKKKKKSNKIYHCGDCEKTYTDIGHLKRHIASSHGERIFKCTQCERSFTLKQYLKKHMVTHTGERKHRCEVCNNSFTQKGSLNLHKLIHSGKKSYICKYCKKPFTHQSGLNIHMLIHTSKTKYPCAMCKKEFKQKKSLKHHMEFYCKSREDNVPKKNKKEIKTNFIKIEEVREENNFEDPLKI